MPLYAPPYFIVTVLAVVSTATTLNSRTPPLLIVSYVVSRVIGSILTVKSSTVIPAVG